MVLIRPYRSGLKGDEASAPFDLERVLMRLSLSEKMQRSHVDEHQTVAKLWDTIDDLGLIIKHKGQLSPPRLRVQVRFFAPSSEPLK